MSAHQRLIGQDNTLRDRQSEFDRKGLTFHLISVCLVSKEIKLHFDGIPLADCASVLFFPLYLIFFFVFPIPHSPHLLLCFVLALFVQTVRDVEQRSSKVSLSWRWRSNGTSAASDVKRATWSSPESTSASEHEKMNGNHSTVEWVSDLNPPKVIKVLKNVIINSGQVSWCFFDFR